MRTDEIQLENEQLITAQRQLLRLDRDLVATTRSFEEQLPVIERNKNIEAVYSFFLSEMGKIEEILPEKSDPGRIMEIHEFLKNHQSHYAQDLRNRTRRNDERRDTRKNMQQRLLALKEQIASMSAVRSVLTTENLREALKSFDNIPQRNIWVGRDNQSRVYARWVHEGIKATPYGNKYLNLNGYERLPVQLPEIITTVYPGRNTLTFTRKRNAQLRNSPGYSGYRQSHPHITESSGTPCLGDFQSSFLDGLNDNDWGTVAAVANMFLETVNDDDAAGAHWPSFIFQERLEDTHFAFDANPELGTPRTTHRLKYMSRSQYLRIKENHPDAGRFPELELDYGSNVYPVIYNNGENIEFYQNVSELKARLIELFPERMRSNA